MTAALLRPHGVPAMSVADLVAGDAGIQIIGRSDTPISHLCLDSRLVSPGDLYVALPGTRAHGVAFAADAVRNGARAILTDPDAVAKAQSLNVPVLVADDPRRSMALLAARLYRHPAEAMTMIGITGTNGKTTTTFLVEAALQAAGQRVATVGTMGFRLAGKALESGRTTVTTPESVDLQALLAVFREGGADTVAMEVSSHALALQRVDGMTFDVAAFTNLGRDHLDFHHTMDAYFAAKALLFEPERSKTCVISIDCDAGVELARRVRESGRPVVTTGAHLDADYRLLGRAGDIVHMVTPSGRVECPVGLPGEYNALNAATALAITDLLGIDRAHCLAGLASAQVPGRMQRVALGHTRRPAPTVIVDFAHTPQAIESALQAVAAPGRIISVLGAGGDRDPDKRGPMAEAAARCSDLVIITDDNPRSEDPATIRRTMLDALTPERLSELRACQVEDGGDRRSAIRRALDLADDRDVVVLLGKGHEQGQIIGERIIDFDDVEVAQQEWSALAGGD